MAVIIPKRKMVQTGHSKSLTIPKNWAKNKKEVSAVVFDMDSKKDRKQFYETQEKIIEEAE